MTETETRPVIGIPAGNAATRWLVALVVLLACAVAWLGYRVTHEVPKVTVQTVESQTLKWVQSDETKIAVQWAQSGGFVTCTGPSDGPVIWAPGSDMDCTSYNSDGTPDGNSKGPYCAMAVIMLPNGGYNVQTDSSGASVCASS